jgi:hypothetical protein
LFGPTEFPDASGSQRRTDGFAFKGPNRLTIDENLNFRTAGNPALNPVIYIGWFHSLFFFLLMNGFDLILGHGLARIDTDRLNDIRQRRMGTYVIADL